MEKATFLQRLIAFAIDFVIVTAIFVGVTILGTKAADAITANLIDDFRVWAIGSAVLIQLINIIIMLAYFVIPWTLSGQTPGKRIMKIKVVKADGTKLPWESAILRWVGYLVGSFALWLGFLWMLVDKKKECWHDKMAGSSVVRFTSCILNQCISMERRDP